MRYLNSKCCSLNEQKKRPARIRWTTSWRRNNKKSEVSVYKYDVMVLGWEKKPGEKDEEEKESMFGYVLKVSGPRMLEEIFEL